MIRLCALVPMHKGFFLFPAGKKVRLNPGIKPRSDQSTHREFIDVIKDLSIIEPMDPVKALKASLRGDT